MRRRGEISRAYGEAGFLTFFVLSWTALVHAAKLTSRNMCGRYSAAGTLDELAKLIDFVCRAPFFAPRYNIAPRQQAPVIVLVNGEPTLKPMRWGLIPAWAKDEGIGDKLINARAETVSEKTSFKKPFEFQRCLVVADGFYEWQLSGRARTPFRFMMKDKSFFCMAGIWGKWIKPPARGEFAFDDEGDTPAPSRVFETFSIITTEANPMVAAVHERMPVILQNQHLQWWIDDRRNGEAVKFMLRPFHADDMDCYRVSPLVNNAKNDSPDCIKPA